MLSFKSPPPLLSRGTAGARVAAVPLASAIPAMAAAIKRIALLVTVAI
jgi:hypothetical protein